MNLVNLFGNKTKQIEPEYFLAVEIHESLIKTALWEVADGEPQVINVGSYESWTDEESLINGVDLSLDQAVKIIKDQPRRVIFGLPESWMDGLKIHSTKTRLISRLCKELGLDPIGMVTINQAIAHFLKKKEGMPPTVILLECYTTKIAVSYIYLGEVKAIEEVAKSGDIAHDVEEGLARFDLPNFPARFVLTNGGGLEEESQQITAYPWQERLPFKHIPKVEVLPVDFSIKAIALTGGTAAVQSLGVEVHTDEFTQEQPAKEEPNIVIPNDTPSTMEELGFEYEETSAPESIMASSDIVDTIETNELEEEVSPETASEEPIYAIPQAQEISIAPRSRPSVKLKLPKIKLVSLPHFKTSWLMLLIIPLFAVVGFVAYLYFGEATITIHFTPEKYSKQLGIAIAEAQQSGIPTLIGSKKNISGSVQESIPTTGTANVGDKATGTITIFNRSVAPIVLKPGTVIGSENGKYNYLISESITIASKSADLISGSEVFGKSEGVKVTATKIGAEYNTSKSSTFTVDNFSKTVAYAVADSEFTGGTSRTVNAVSKADQDRLLNLASEKIKLQIATEIQTQSLGSKLLPLSELQFTKKQFDKNISEEATTLSIDLTGSQDVLVYSEDSLYELAISESKSQIPAGSITKKETTAIKLENTSKNNGQYQAVLNIEAVLYPTIDEQKLAGYIKGKFTNDLRHFFDPIRGFKSADVKVSPPIPFITRILPMNNIKFELVSE